MKLNRKLVLILALVLSVAMATTGTLAFLTDRDNETNIFTVGNVDIDLVEDFEQGSELIPGKKINKDATIKNVGKNDAWVWLTYAVPEALLEEDFSDADTSLNPVHINWAGSSWFGYSGATEPEDRCWKVDYAEQPGVEINGVKYRVCTSLYNGILSPDETTSLGLTQVYMDTHIDIDPNGDLYWVENGVTTKLDWNINNSGAPKIYLSAYAIQADGFETVEAAYAAYGEQWGTNHNAAYTEPLVVNTVAALTAALEAGETDIVVKDAVIDENPFNGHYYKDRNVDFVDCTITANMNWMYINDASFTNCTFDSGLANSAVHYDELFGDLVFNNCEFKSGKIQIGTNTNGTSTVTFNNCEFAETTQTHSIWTEMGIRVYSPATFNNCEFNNRVVMAGFAGQSLTFDGCTMNGGDAVYYVDNTDGIIRGGNVPNVTVR